MLQSGFEISEACFFVSEGVFSNNIVLEIEKMDKNERTTKKKDL